MKKILFLLLCIGVNISTGRSQTKAETEVAAAAEKFRQAMLKPEEGLLKKLTSTQLTYGHSTGVVQDQATCIETLVSGKSSFQSIDISDQTITVQGNTAILRHVFFAHTHDAGKEPGTVTLKIMQVWVKTGANWQLLARQAVKYTKEE